MHPLTAFAPSSARRSLDLPSTKSLAFYHWATRTVTRHVKLQSTNAKLFNTGSTTWKLFRLNWKN